MENIQYPWLYYLDVLAILVRMSLSEQKEEHDPAKAVRRIQDFQWTMAKLQVHVQGALEEDELSQEEKSRLTYYSKFRSEVTFNLEDNSYIYQGKKLNISKRVDARYWTFTEQQFTPFLIQ